MFFFLHDMHVFSCKILPLVQKQSINLIEKIVKSSARLKYTQWVVGTRSFLVQTQINFAIHGETKSVDLQCLPTSFLFDEILEIKV